MYIPEQQPFYSYLKDSVSFESRKASACRMVYAPLCGPDDSSLKSSITPFLSGDIKIDKNRYLTKPASTQDLRQTVRNAFVNVQDDLLALNDLQGDARVRVGLLWHELENPFAKQGVTLEALNFVPVNHPFYEYMKLTVRNTSGESRNVQVTAAIPVFGRVLANKHDHEHVSSLLNEARQHEHGVVVAPRMIFNEEGHLPTNNLYFVLGADENGNPPSGTFPTVDAFVGDGGTLDAPEALLSRKKPRPLPLIERDGKEAVGALQFESVALEPGESISYVLIYGITDSSMSLEALCREALPVSVCERERSATEAYWKKKIGTLDFQTGDSGYNAWLRWVTIQPVLRRIYGCSFLPDHDYGKGGRGWRDLWQDLLSLILIEPEQVREILLNNFAGVRVDGTNATIIGNKPGEFIADRNAITRVWMDHGAWPLLTTLLYIHQTGDLQFLFEEQTYFRDPQIFRASRHDDTWNPDEGSLLQDSKGSPFRGTVLEHLLVQHLCAFFNVGSHNNIRLENADWNDAFDMAPENGESVAFTALYGGNLLQCAEMIETASRRLKIPQIKLSRELLLLLDTIGEKVNYDDPDAKHERLYQVYFPAVQPAPSGETESVDAAALVQDLRVKGEWILNHIRENEQIEVEDQGQTYRWYNGYYDNTGRRVEGREKGRVRMTLTGQVFPLMAQAAREDDARDVIAAVDTFLKDPHHQGYRLNTDFDQTPYLDLGRAFGFAYGTKENGSVFSHMAVMYAYALYSRGFSRAGDAVLESLYRLSADTEKSKIYPGIPEYFDGEGRGMYHYLTGSASWLILTELTQVFGVRGRFGDLVIDPQLRARQFDDSGHASVGFFFAGMNVTIRYENPQRLDAGEYRVCHVEGPSGPVTFEKDGEAGGLISRTTLMPPDICLNKKGGTRTFLNVRLDKRSG